jgi:Na+/H+ antiporter NhaD/arsenite permease-like protein
MFTARPVQIDDRRAMANLLSLPLILATTALPDPHPLFILPFAALLLCIAFLPLFLRHHWERHYPKISVGLALVSITYYVFGLNAGWEMAIVGMDYFSFMVVVGSLFVTAGSIHLRVKGGAKPWFNCLFLAIGTLLGNLIGTTGASILLIRPWLQMNRYRFTGHHLAFFIFTVANLGGALTPMGPPLLMGYLKGVPFWWALQHCWKPWCVMALGIFAAFYFIDRLNFLRAPRDIREAETTLGRWHIDGARNLLFLAIILLALILLPSGLRELTMIAATTAAWFTTPRRVHQANEFSFAPVTEVAWLFFGIFATMKPALDFMDLHANQLGLHTDRQFFWASGILSGILDNAPTYLTFLAAAFGLHHLNLDSAADMQIFLAHHGHYLVAISLASACFGGLTYLGNGPNLMVKAIADHSKVKSPGFLMYIVRFAVPILLPIFALVGWLFF